MPKILRIINRFNIGGPTYNAAYLTKYLAPEFETLLVGGQKDYTEDSSEFILESLGLKPVLIEEMKREIGIQGDYQSYKKLKEIIGDFKPDIVHTHASKAGAVGRMAASKLNVPLIFHTFHGHVFHSYFSPTKTKIYKNIERYLAKKTTKIIAISEIQRMELSQIHKICPLEKIEVIPLGFDLNRFRENQEEKRIRFRRTWNIDDDEITIGIVGRLVPIKDHSLFLNAAKRVNEHTSKRIKFIIVGDGELKNDLKTQVAALQLNNVLFTSWIKNIDEVNAGLDIMCLTSKNEGTPVSLIEAQAAGLPIVSTNVGGIANIIKVGENALLSESGSIESLAQNLLSLIENDEKRTLFSKKGEHVFESFHYTRLIEDMHNLYKRELNRKNLL
jgi:glycosyltransferase involved in cell wall biosynthesis